MGFKEDVQFLRYLSMGAAGAAAIVRDLRDVHGHRAVELERYAMANKLWATKVKRLRLPDLMCLHCGRRIESKAKSALELKLSHSEKQDREWDAAMRDEDVFAFIRCDAAVEPIKVAQRPVYFCVRALRQAREHAKEGPRKSASEGSEKDLTWTMRVPRRSGEVLEIQERRVHTKLERGQRQTYRLAEEVPAFVYVEPGDRFVGGETPLLGIVAPVEDLSCPGDTWDYERDLGAPDPIDRYAAVKAVGILGDERWTDRLIAVARSRGRRASPARGTRKPCSTRSLYLDDQRA